MNELHLFAGAGGGILAGQLLGHRPVCAVEWDPYAQAVLVARQNDGTFPPFPIWDDVQTFDGRPWRGIVDIVAGGFPCQDISVAGGGAGIDGARSGMWRHMARIIGEVRPRFAFIENSPALVSRGLDRVLADLAALGFDAQWGVMGASDVGAPHHRQRIWILANARGGRLCEQGQGEDQQQRGTKTQRAGHALGDPECIRCPTRRDDHRRHDRPELGPNGEHAQQMADADSLRKLQPQRHECEQRGRPCHCGADVPHSHSHSLQRMVTEPQQSGHGRPAGLHDRTAGLHPWPADPADAPESGLGRVAHGVAHRSYRIKAIGNGQVPRVAATAFNLLSKISL